MSRIINGECLEVMDKLIEEGIKVDAVICDPPYGTTACKWDSVIPLGDMWERLHKLVKEDGAICLFGAEPFSSALRMSNIKEYKYDWYWYKNMKTNFANARHQPMRAIENISIFYNKKCVYNPIKTKRTTQLAGNKKNTKTTCYRRFSEDKQYDNQSDMILPHNVLEIKCIHTPEKRFHPTQKPVALMEYLIKTYTNEGDTVLDFTCGSGSTGVACVNTNRNFIGIELDKKYYDIAVQRCKEAKGERNE